MTKCRFKNTRLSIGVTRVGVLLVLNRCKELVNDLINADLLCDIITSFNLKTVVIYKIFSQ